MPTTRLLKSTHAFKAASTFANRPALDIPERHMNRRRTESGLQVCKQQKCRSKSGISDISLGYTKPCTRAIRDSNQKLKFAPMVSPPKLFKLTSAETAGVMAYRTPAMTYKPPESADAGG